MLNLTIDDKTARDGSVGRKATVVKKTSWKKWWSAGAPAR